MLQKSDFAAYMADFPPDHPFFRGLGKFELKRAVPPRKADAPAPEPRQPSKSAAKIEVAKSEAVDSDRSSLEVTNPSSVEASIRLAFIHKLEQRWN